MTMPFFYMMIDSWGVFAATVPPVIPSGNFYGDNSVRVRGIF